MDATRFDRWTRAISVMPSRRQALAMLLGAFGLWQGMDGVSAGPGCKNVGKKCKKNQDCCSGICQGKKGKKRKGKCKAHNTGGCPTGLQSFACGGADVACTTSAGEAGRCETTTGQASYCYSGGLVCNTDCQKDADCRVYCGPDAACIACTACGGAGATACVGPTKCEV